MALSGPDAASVRHILHLSATSSRTRPAKTRLRPSKCIRATPPWNASGVTSRSRARLLSRRVAVPSLPRTGDSAGRFGWRAADPELTAEFKALWVPRPPLGESDCMRNAWTWSSRSNIIMFPRAVMLAQFLLVPFPRVLSERPCGQGEYAWSSCTAGGVAILADVRRPARADMRRTTCMVNMGGAKGGRRGQHAHSREWARE